MVLDPRDRPLLMADMLDESSDVRDCL